MIWRDDGEFRDRRERVSSSVGGDVEAFDLRTLQKPRMLDAPLSIGAQPVIGIMAIDEPFDFAARPIGERRG